MNSDVKQHLADVMAAVPPGVPIVDPTISDVSLWVELNEFVTSTFLYITTVFVVVGGIIPYWFQYREIIRTQNARGFSLFVCLTLLVANIARILFWFGKRFEVQLLLQSIIMVMCMLTMIKVAVRINRKHLLPPHRTRTGDLVHHFWQWSDFSSYLVCSAGFTILISLLTFVFRHSRLYIEMLGFVALLLEAMIGTPQFYNNFKRRSTVGMSVKMVSMWLTGDIAKTVYFLMRRTPAQFWLCGVLQVGVDILILSQVAYYRRRNEGRSPAVQTPTDSFGNAAMTSVNNSTPNSSSLGSSRSGLVGTSIGGSIVPRQPQTVMVPPQMF